MSHPASSLWLAAAVAITGSVAHAAPRHAPHEDPDVEIVDEPDAVDEDDEVDETPPLRAAPATHRAEDWHVAVGPYVWASAVDANISVGGSDVGKGIDFASLSKHAKFGMELLSEVRYRRFALTTDLTYGVVGITASEQVGPLMVTLDGTASSLLVDGALGYMAYGDDHSKLAVEPRAGVRYQRTVVRAAVGIAGAAVEPPETVMASQDLLVGARVFVRPYDRLFFTGTADLGVAGTSSSTWSMAADATVRVSSHVMLSLGYRTLTMDGASINIVMHGPRGAFQLTF